MITLWRKQPRTRQLERWGHIPDFMLHATPTLEPGQTWNVMIPPINEPVPIDDRTRAVDSAASLGFFTVQLIRLNGAPHWVIVGGEKALIEYRDCATFPRARDG